MELWNPKPLSKGAARKQRARQRLTAEERNDVRDNDRKRKRLAAAAEAVAAALFSAPPVSTPGSSAPYRQPAFHITFTFIIQKAELGQTDTAGTPGCHDGPCMSRCTRTDAMS